MKETAVKYADIESVNERDAQALFEQAKADIAADMEAREIGAILWDNAQAGFHYPPEVTVTDSVGKQSVWEIRGLYRVGDQLYLIGPGASASVDNYYKKGIEEKPVVVTLTEAQAMKQLGIPNQGRGYTRQGDVREWLSIADCYFEALNLDNDL